MRMLAKAGLISLAIFMASCSNPFRAKSSHSEEAMTIGQIYDRHQSKTQRAPRHVSFMPDSAARLAGYTREVNNELSVHFPRLPNPTIILYVFPHLSLDGTPVPGYSTTFPLYESVEYALPGEVVPQ